MRPRCSAFLNEVPEHMAQELLGLFVLAFTVFFLNEVPEHMAQEWMRPARSGSRSRLLNEVPEHMAQELPYRKVLLLSP